MVDVAAGLDALHARGIVHRDLKPSNILLGDGRARIADLGIALAEPSELTTLDTTVGTLAYLAPEQLAGEPASPASDVHALGVTAFLGLTGSLPRPAGSLAEFVAAEPSAGAAACPGWLRSIGTTLRPAARSERWRGRPERPADGRDALGAQASSDAARLGRSAPIVRRRPSPATTRPFRARPSSGPTRIDPVAASARWIGVRRSSCWPAAVAASALAAFAGLGPGAPAPDPSPSRPAVASLRPRPTPSRTPTPEHPTPSPDAIAHADPDTDADARRPTPTPSPTPDPVRRRGSTRRAPPGRPSRTPSTEDASSTQPRTPASSRCAWIGSTGPSSDGDVGRARDEAERFAGDVADTARPRRLGRRRRRSPCASAADDLVAAARRPARLIAPYTALTCAPVSAGRPDGILARMKTILVIDDERNIVELLRLYLEKEGWAVHLRRRRRGRPRAPPAPRPRPRRPRPDAARGSTASRSAARSAGAATPRS